MRPLNQMIGRSGCLALMFLSACSSSESASTQATTLSSTEDCIAKGQEQSCALLTPTTLSAFVPSGVQPESQSSSGDCSYSWEGGRQKTMEVGANTFSFPVNDEAVLNGLRKLNDDAEVAARQFAAMYRTPDAKQKERMKKAAQERVEKDVDAAHQDVGRDAASRFVNAIEYTPVPDVGDAAAWGGAGIFKQLYVRVGRYVFQTRLTRSDDEAKVIRDSAELARKVIEQCSG